MNLLAWHALKLVHTLCLQETLKSLEGSEYDALSSPHPSSELSEVPTAEQSSRLFSRTASVRSSAASTEEIFSPNGHAASATHGGSGVIPAVGRVSSMATTVSSSGELFSGKAGGDSMVVLKSSDPVVPRPTGKSLDPVTLPSSSMLKLHSKPNTDSASEPDTRVLSPEPPGE